MRVFFSLRITESRQCLVLYDVGRPYAESANGADGTLQGSHQQIDVFHLKK